MRARDRRALIAGGAVAAAAILGTRALPSAWRAAWSARDQLQTQAELLARAREDVAAATGLEDSGAKLKMKVLALAPRILAGTRQAEAIADLTGRITSLAGTHRMRLERTAPLDDSVAAGGLRRISLRVALSGDSRGTLGLLGALARGPVALAATEVRIVAPNPLAPPATAEVLQTEVTVRGWYQEGEEKP